MEAIHQARGLVDSALELAEFQVGLVLDRADLSSPAERDRALAEAAPVLAGMGESATRDELVRSVAERLDMDPAMVIGRMASARTQVESGGDGESGSTCSDAVTAGPRGPATRHYAP